MRQEIEIDGHATPRASGASGRGLEVPCQQRVVEALRTAVDADAEPLDGATTLELVERYVHSGVVQPPQRSFEPEIAHERGHVAELDAGGTEQTAIDVVPAPVHGAFEQRDERVGSPGELRGHLAAGLALVQRGPEEARQLRAVASKDAEVVEQSQIAAGKEYSRQRADAGDSLTTEHVPSTSPSTVSPSSAGTRSPRDSTTTVPQTTRPPPASPKSPRTRRARGPPRRGCGDHGPRPRQLAGRPMP